MCLLNVYLNQIIMISKRSVFVGIYLWHLSEFKIVELTR